MVLGLRIVLVEDSPADAELIERELRKSGLVFDTRRIETSESLILALDEFKPNLILSDYSIPGFSGLSALDIATAKCPEVPFIFVSGTLGEELAIETLKKGATDYILKDRITRLGAAVTRALAEVAERAERRLAEDRYKRAEEIFRLVVENSLDVFAMIDSRGAIEYVSPAAQTVLGYSPDEMKGKNAVEFVWPEETLKVQQDLERAMESGAGPAALEVHARHKDGSRRTLEVIATPVKGSRVVVARDVTERKQLEAQLRHSQRMESIGTLAGGVAHDFNNLLTAIMGHAQLGLMDADQNAPLKAHFWEIASASKRAADLTRQLLAFSRRQPLAPRPLDLNASIAGIEKMLRRLISEDIELSFELDKRLLPIKGDPGQIEQIVMNLAVNARDAMPRGGQITVRTRLAVFTEADCRDRGYARPGNYSIIEVGDTGTGISAEVRQRIFEPFFTTKAPGQGTGLGLAVVYGIVKQHSGVIEVDSSVGEGTVFTICLPAITDAVQPESTRDEPAPRGSGELILVAEDEDALMRLLLELLEGLGYNVLAARNGLEALELFKANRDVIRLMVLDVVMPKMGGREVYECIRGTGSRAPVIFVTGYNKDVINNDMPGFEEAVIIQKPYAVDDLGRRVRSLLDQHAWF